MTFPSPKNVLRIAVNFCLIGWGASAIWQAKHVGPGYDRLGWIHDLALFFFSGLIAFTLFLAEYHLVQVLSKRELNHTWGYVQSLGCFFLFLTGIWGIYYSHWRPLAPQDRTFPDSALRALYILGHAIFIGNIIWSYVHEGDARETSGSGR